MYNRSQHAFNPQNVPPISIWRQPMNNTNIKVSKFSENRMSKITNAGNNPIDLRQLTEFNVDHNLSRDKIRL